MNPDTLFVSKQSISSPELKRMTSRQILSFSAVIFQAVCWLPVPMKDSSLHHARRLMRVSVRIWAQMSRRKFDVPLKTGVPSLSKSSIKPPITLRLKLVLENFRSLMSRQSARYIQEINEKMEIVQHKGLNCSVERWCVLPLTVRGGVLVNFTNCLFLNRTFPLRVIINRQWYLRVELWCETFRFGGSGKVIRVFGNAGELVLGIIVCRESN